MAKGTALITGASSGIGAALAHKFAAEGFDLVVTARREDRLRQLADDLAGSVTVHVIAADLGLDADVTRLMADVDALGLAIDVLVNNAGLGTSGDFAAQDEAGIANLLAVNISALTRLTHHFLQPMLAAGSGRILNVASVVSFQPVPSMSTYAASKAYVLSLTESLSEELRGTGVSVTALCPGLTQTEMVEDVTVGAAVPPFMIASAEAVAQEGYNALMAREVIRIPGPANQAAVTWAQYQPRWLVRGIGGVFSRMARAAR